MRKLQTTLKSRELRFDGVNIVNPEVVPELLMSGLLPKDIRVTEINPDVELFNKNVAAHDHLKINENSPISIPLSWNIPVEFLSLELADIVIDAFEKRLPNLDYSDKQIADAIDRIQLELTEIERRGMCDFFKTIIYIISEFRKTNTIWGVGRGSSCASYILFLLGLHVVDAIKFDIPADEFFHD